MRWPFTGRDAELRLVGEALSDGAAGGVVIAGLAGVGKTRLAAEASELAGGQGCAVEWVRASRSARSIPLGAFAALLPATNRRLPEGVELLARARHALAERAAGRRLVLCVDDGQLLDDASASLVHQLVAAGEAFAVVSVRRDEPGPDALRALWKDELCVLLELAELSRGEVEALLGAGLGGPMDGRSVNALWELTRGNALFLRELVRHGVDHGLLAQDGGLWRWRGEVKAGTRLAELMDVRIEDAGASGRRVLEVVAVGAPLEVGLLEPAELEALEALERAELVQRRTDGRRRFVDVAHPLYGEAVRAQLTPTRVEAIHTRLGDAVQARGARRGGDLLRIAVWRLEAGVNGEAGLFARAAGQALGAADAALAGRLARAAVQAGGGFGARLTLARALAGAGRAREAQQLLVELAAQAGDDRERAAVAVASARNLFWGLDRADDADAVLQDAEHIAGNDALRHELAAQRVRLTAAQGRPRAALAAAQPLLDDASVDERAGTTVALGAIEALFSSGRSNEAVALAEAWMPAARRHGNELPHAEPVLLGMRALALRLAGRLVEATTLSEDAYAALLPRRSAVGTAVEANSLGLIWLARGRVRTALRFCRESAALLRDGDAVGMLAFALAGVGQSAGQAGEAQAAHAAVAEMERTPLGHKGFAVELELARAWSAAASGELTGARAYARGAAALAQSRGQDAYAVRALHELCRLGDPATAEPELARLAGTVDGPFAATAAAHAAALVAGDGTALLDTAERFAAADALLVAAEAADAAATAQRNAGRLSSARAAAARAALWLTKCEGARPPTMVAAPDAVDLTAREREIALLAAAGASSREIADRLVISVRTVDNHLQNAYRKLGVTRRQDLHGVLSATSEEP
jgi:DNA-binding CsgD family transcriptional regulator